MAQDSTDWIEWAGGECPVAEDTLLQFRARSGFESGIYNVAGWETRSKLWQHGAYPADVGTDIIAYRVVQA